MLADILGYVIKSPTQISRLRVDIVRTCEYTYSQDVTSHPVEAGYEIHDSIVNKPMVISLTVGISSSPVTWFWSNGSGKSKFSNALRALEAIRDAKEPVTIVRPDKLLENMVLTDIRYTNSDESKSIIWVDLSFKQIVKVVTQVVDIPEGVVDGNVKESVGQTAADGGAATQTDIGDIASGVEITDVNDADDLNSDKSWLKSLIDSIKGNGKTK